MKMSDSELEALCKEMFDVMYRWAAVNLFGFTKPSGVLQTGQVAG